MKVLNKSCAIALSLILLISGLAGCGGTKASDKAVSVAKSAIEVADDYLDHKLTRKQADNKLSALESEMDYVDDLEAGEEHKAADFSIRASITALSSDIFLDDLDGTSESYDKVVESRNKLAKKAGLGKR